VPPPAEPLSSDIYTNRHELKQWRDKFYSRAEWVKFLHDEPRPSDRMALHALSGDPRLLHDFTGDVAPLIAALSHDKPRTGVDLVSALSASKPAIAE